MHVSLGQYGGQNNVELFISNKNIIENLPVSPTQVDLNVYYVEFFLSQQRILARDNCGHCLDRDMTCAA